MMVSIVPHIRQLMLFAKLLIAVGLLSLLPHVIKFHKRSCKKYRTIFVKISDAAIGAAIKALPVTIKAKTNVSKLATIRQLIPFIKLRRGLSIIMVQI
jgi:hypothetical protein